MDKQLAKNLMCICLRNNVEIWAEDEKIKNLKKVLMAVRESKFIELENEVINSADILGIFDAQTMEDKTRRKNGQWKCKADYWHEKFEKCECNISIPSYAKSYIK